MRGVSVREAVVSARTALGQAGVASPELDAELLVAAAIAADRTRLRIEPERELDRQETRWLRAAVRRRAVQREPLAYIVGRRAFRRIELAVNGDVLIPRPETEHLVEAALSLPTAARVHDACTGSGAVALALADERPDLEITASDISAAAVAVARANATRLNLAVRIATGALLDPFAAERLDAIVANPPYVEDGARLNLQPEIVRHEPAIALYAGVDGLAVLRPLIAAAARSTAYMLALEIGAGQERSVRELVCAAGFSEVEAIADLAGIARVIVGQR